MRNKIILIARENELIYEKTLKIANENNYEVIVLTNNTNFNIKLNAGSNAGQNRIIFLKELSIDYILSELIDGHDLIAAVISFDESLSIIAATIAKQFNLPHSPVEGLLNIKVEQRARKIINPIFSDNKSLVSPAVFDEAFIYEHEKGWLSTRENKIRNVSLDEFVNQCLNRIKYKNGYINIRYKMIDETNFQFYNFHLFIDAKNLSEELMGRIVRSQLSFCLGKNINYLEDVIDLRSDTFTKPTYEMLDAMCQAASGDDCYGEDKEVTELEKYCMQYFGKKAAVYLPTATMANQVAVAALTHEGDEIITDSSYHVSFFESSQTSVLSRVAFHSLHTDNGIITPKLLDAHIDRKARWSETYAVPRLLILENTINAHGGKIFPLSAVKDLAIYARSKNMSIHMDGSRILNACAASAIAPEEYSQYVDTLTVCFAKGLSAPIGAVLLGSEETIAKARKLRKWYGGALHQGGYMAATALHGLKHNFHYFEQDNLHAKKLALKLREKGVYVEMPDTNIVFLDVSLLSIRADEFVSLANQQGVKVLAWRGNLIRMVTYRNISAKDIEKAADLIARIYKNKLSDHWHEMTEPHILKLKEINNLCKTSILVAQNSSGILQEDSSEAFSSGINKIIFCNYAVYLNIMLQSRLSNFDIIVVMPKISFAYIMKIIDTLGVEFNHNLRFGYNDQQSVQLSAQLNFMLSKESAQDEQCTKNNFRVSLPRKTVQTQVSLFKFLDGGKLKSNL